MSLAAARIRRKKIDSAIARSQTHAVHCLERKKYGEALAHLSVLFSLDPECKASLKSLYFKTMGLYTALLEEREDWDTLFEAYGHSLELYPDSEELHFELGNHLKKLDCKSKASLYYQKALILNPEFTKAKIEFETLKNELVERWHFSMLNDYTRNTHFDRAICHAIKHGHDVVLDIGAGTGILSMCAVRGGSKHVTACELSTAMFDIATEVLQLNNMASSVKLLNKPSTELLVPQDLPHRVSLVVTETFDAGLLGENILTTLNHAWKHLLLPPQSNPNEKGFGKVIPEKATAYAALVESEWLREKQWLRRQTLGPLDLSKVRIFQQEAAQDPYTTEKLSRLPGGFTFLSDPEIAFTIDFNNSEEVARLASGVEFSPTSYVCTLPGCLDALVFWFELDLGGNVKVTTEPLIEQNSPFCCWDQAIFPILPYHFAGSLPKEMKLVPGEKIIVTMAYAEHLRLIKVSSSNPAFDLPNSYPTILLPGDMVARLNCREYTQPLIAQLSALPWQRDEGLSVLDISPVPWMALVALQMGAKQVSILESDHSFQIQKLASSCGLHLDSIRRKEELIQQGQEFDVLIADPLEASGILATNFFQILSIYRQFCLKSPGGILVPSHLQLSAQLIHSPELLQGATVLDDKLTLGFQIGKVINMYETVLHLDLNLAALPHKVVSEPLTICSLDLHQEILPLLSGTALIECTGPKVTAVAFWLTTDMAGAKIQQNVAAYLLNPPLYLETFPQSLNLDWSIQDSFIQLSIAPPFHDV